MKDKDVLSLEGKVAAVTGAASGVGSGCRCLFKGNVFAFKTCQPVFIKGLTVEISCKISDFFQIASPLLSR